MAKIKKLNEQFWSVAIVAIIRPEMERFKIGISKYLTSQITVKNTVTSSTMDCSALPTACWPPRKRKESDGYDDDSARHGTL
jgi:hypothetical protein